MVTPNYGYEKRQKELAKKRKKEEKLKEKALRKQAGPGGEGDHLPDAADAGSSDGGSAGGDGGGD